MHTTSLTARTTNRLFALDVFRGLTIIGMILANSPSPFEQLSHAYWDGLHLADFVFPFFIFIVGVAVSLGLRGAQAPGFDRGHAVRKVVKRTALLFALGIGVNMIYTDFSAVRVLGVLQRIALVYLVCSLMVMFFYRRHLVYSLGFILISYWMVLLFVPAPGIEAGSMERGSNLVNWFDEQFLPGMLWRGTWDPEGMLSTWPAIASGLLGVWCGSLIAEESDLTSATLKIFVLGSLALIAGYLWSFLFPFNKALWSSSFVLTTGGVGAIILALLLWHTDLSGHRSLTYVSTVFGANAITAYILHILLGSLLGKDLYGESIHSRFVSSMNELGSNETVTGILWLAIFLTLCFIPMWAMYRKKWFVKI